MDRSAALFELAANQQGFFTAKQAEQLGYVANNHAYHLRAGHWIRELRGVYRLAQFPNSSDEQKVLYALWSLGRDGKTQGVYSHETALSHYELSDVNPSRLYMTVATTFRRSAAIPKVLRLHYADLTKNCILESRGFLVTRPDRTIADIIACQRIPFDIIRQSVTEAASKGLVPKRELLTILRNAQLPVELRRPLRRLLQDLGG